MDQQIHEKIKTVNVWWEDAKLHIPVYLAEGQSRALIDSGPPQRKPGALASALEPYSLKPADIEMVLLTHGHLDHVGGLSELRAAGPVKLVISQEDAFFLTDHAKAFDEFYSVGERMLTGKDDLSDAKKGFLMGAGPEYTPDRIIADGDIIELGEGLELTAVHLPGHSPGTIAFYWEKEGISICGDAIPALSSPDGSLPVIMDLNAYRNSIDRLLTLPLKTLVFTHGYRAKKLPPSTVRRGGEIKEYLTDAKEVADRLIEVLQKESPNKGKKPFPQIVDRVIEAMPSEMKFAPLEKQFNPMFSVSTVFWGFALLDASR